MCAGDRTTVRRATLDEPLVFASAFCTGRGPGVAALTRTGNLLVHSMPGLELLLAAPLTRVLGFPFCATQGTHDVVCTESPRELAIGPLSFPTTHIRR